MLSKTYLSEKTEDTINRSTEEESRPRVVFVLGRVSPEGVNT